MNEKNSRGKIFITKGFKETQDLGIELAKQLKGGSFVALYGDLGSGKTTFVQGLAKGLGIKKRIISPTFVIVRSYGIRNKELGIRNLFHIDLYRVDSEKDIESLGIEEIINNKDNIVVVEWADKMQGLMPEKRIDIRFFYEKSNIRKVVFRFLNQ